MPTPHRIIWDGKEEGEVRDGGNDMYGWPPYGGNRISTSLCHGHSRVAPYGDDFGLHQSECFGPGGSFRMVSTWHNLHSTIAISVCFLATSSRAHARRRRR